MRRSARPERQGITIRGLNSPHISSLKTLTTKQNNMKKTLLSFLVALMTIGTAFAETKVVYSWESPDGTPVETGGTAAYVNGDGERLNYKNDAYYTMCLNGKQGNLKDDVASANAGHIVITLTEAVAEGDVINVTAYRNKNADGKNASIYFLYENGTEVKDNNTFVNICKEGEVDFDNDGETPNTVQIAVPAEAAGSKTITLTRNAASTNLFILKFEITREVADTPGEKLEIVELSPADGSEMETMTDIKLSTNQNDKIGWLTYKLTDLTTDNPEEKVLINSYLPKLEDGTFYSDAISYYAIKMYEGHDYELEFIAYESEEAKRNNQSIDTLRAHYKGLVKPYQYSTVTLESITPDPNDINTKLTANENIVTLVFSAPVTIDQATTVNVESATTSDKGKTWELTVSKSAMEEAIGSVKVGVVAIDETGLRVKGNQGIEDETMFEWNFYCNMAAPDLIISPAEGSLAELKDITIKSPLPNPDDNIGFAYTTTDSIIVWKDNRTAIAKFGEEDLDFILEPDPDPTHEGYMRQVGAVLHLPQTITEPGRYTVEIPDGFFRFGEQYNSYLNKATFVTYLIEEAPKELNITADPANNSNVEKLEVITVTFNDYEDAAPSWNYNASVKDSEGNEVTTGTIDYGDDWNILNQCKITLESPVTANGTYTVEFPAGAFLLGSDGANSEAFSLTYTIGEVAPVVITDPADGSTVDMLKDIKITFESETDAAGGSGNAVLTDAEGKEVTTGICETGSGSDAYNVCHIVLNSEVTAAGTYKLSVPAGAFILGPEGDRQSEAMEFTYIVSGLAGIDNLLINSNETVSIYNTNGMLVRQGKAAEAVKGLNGLYIINGKKVMLKK